MIARRHVTCYHLTDDVERKPDENDMTKHTAELADEDPEQTDHAMAEKRLFAIVAETIFLLYVPTETLHRKHVVHAFFNRCSGNRTGSSSSLAATTHDT